MRQIRRSSLAHGITEACAFMPTLLSSRCAKRSMPLPMCSPGMGGTLASVRRFA
jgi:hypothetical protein